MAKTNKQRWYNFFIHMHVDNNCSIVSWLGTFEFDQGHVTKNQTITLLVLLSESLGL